MLLGALYGIFQHAGETTAIEDVVAQDKAGTIVADEFFANDESLSQAIGTGLFCIFEAYPQLRTVAQQTLKSWQVVRGRDNQYLADACQHQCGDRVVNHRFVKDRYQLF